MGKCLLIAIVSVMGLSTASAMEGTRLGRVVLPNLAETGRGVLSETVVTATCHNLGREEGRMGEIVLLARGKDAYITGVDVTYRNGNTRSLNMKPTELDRGSSKLNLTLNGRRGRCVDSIQVHGYSLSETSNARIVIRGLKKKDRARREAVKLGDMGMVKAKAYRKRPTSALQINSCADGGLGRLYYVQHKDVVRGTRVGNITINFDRGAPQVIAVSENYGVNSSSQEYKLNPARNGREGRCVQSIVVNGHSLAKRKFSVLEWYAR